VEQDTPEDIVAVTRELLRALVDANDLTPDAIAGAWFITTRDLRSEFPAVAARQLGWIDVPLLCGHEMQIALGHRRRLARCIEVMLVVNTERTQAQMRSVLLRRAHRRGPLSPEGEGEGVGLLDQSEPNRGAGDEGVAAPRRPDDPSSRWGHQVVPPDADDM